jgi:hypothetical protein
MLDLITNFVYNVPVLTRERDKKLNEGECSSISSPKGAKE